MSFFSRTEIKVDIQNVLEEYNKHKDKWPWANNKVALNNHTGQEYDVTDTRYKLVYTEYKYINRIFMA